MKLNLNLEILKPSSCNYLLVLDTSTYPFTPTSATLKVYLPGYSNAYTFEDFTVSQVNSYNSYNFDLSVEDELTELPDGLYKFVFDTCPTTETLTVYHLRACKLRCRLAKLWAKCFLSCHDDEALLRLDRIEFLIRGAEANAEMCNPTEATNLYTKAYELLQRIEDPCY